MGELERSLFSPQSIALIGLSSDPSRPTGRPLRFLRRAGFAGDIHIVNPRRDEVQGERAYPDLASLPSRPDHAYVLLGTERVEAALADCAEAGVQVATVLADGFAESGAEGRARQDRLISIAREAGMRLLGPNSMGVADLHSGCWLTVNAIYDEADHPKGQTALFSQSGSMMGALISRAKGLGLGFSRVVAVGNEADLGVAEIATACLDDPNTDVFALFIETIRDADALARFATAAHERGKPVIAYKLGRSKLGQDMAVAHTGALLSDDAVSDAFLRDIGIARVTTLDALVEAPVLFRGRAPLSKTEPKIGVVTTTGGGGATVCDRLALEGIGIHPPSADTMAAVRSTGLDIVDGPMIDLTMAGAGPEFVRPTIEAVARDTEVDIVLSVTGSSGRSSPERTVQPLVDADLGEKPFAAFITPDASESLRGLLARGLPAFRTPESCADALGAFIRWRAPRLQSLACLPSLDIGTPMDEAASLHILSEAGVPVVDAVTLAPGETPDLPYPVVLKVLSSEIPHKTEAGGVITGIRNASELVAASKRIVENIAQHDPETAVTRLLAAPMVTPLQEVLIGYRLDPQLGPVVTLAPGGIMVGLHPEDRAIAMAPVDLDIARRMIDTVPGLAPIRGHRNRPHGDISALAAAIVALSRLALSDRLILEAEANPMMVMTDGVVAADALVICKEENST